MLGAVGRWISNHIAFSSLRSKVQHSPWLAHVLLKINKDLNRVEDCLPSTFLDSLSQDQSAKQEFAERLGTRLFRIAESLEPKLECRRWIVELAREYAPLKCMFVSKPDLEARGLHWHPCLTGAFDNPELLIEMMKDWFPEVLKTCDTYSQAIDKLQTKSLEKNYELTIADLVRFHLGDSTRPSERDWLMPFINTSAAASETEIRNKLKIGRPCDRGRINTERALIELNILAENDDPLDGVIFAKRFADWKDDVHD